MRKFHIILLFLLAAFHTGYTQPKIQYKIDGIDVEFTKTKSFDADAILINIASVKGGFFNGEIISTDARRIEKFYFNKGFLHAKVDTVVKYDKEDKETEIVFKILENKRSNVSEISYAGLEDVAPLCRDEIYNNKGVQAGKPYEKSKVEEEVVRVLTVLKNYGYAMAEKGKVEIENRVSNKKNKADAIRVKLSFKPGEIYRFGKVKIQIKDNKYGLNDENFRKHFKFREGEVFSQDKLNKTADLINANPLIENIKFEPEAAPGNIINYTLNVKLRYRFEVKPLVLAYDINNLFYEGAGLGFSDRHFLGGDGRVFSGTVQNLYHSPDDNILEVETDVTQPYLFGNENITGNLKLGGTYTVQEFFSIVGVVEQMTVGYKLPKHTYVNNVAFDWELSNLNFSTRKPIIGENDEGELDTLNPFDINIFLSTLGFSASHDNVNNLLFPTRGFYQYIEMKESGLLGNLVEKLFNSETYKYFKVQTVNKAYYDFSDNGSSVLAAKFVTGAIFDYGTNEVLNLKFTAGGSASNRGWRSRTLGIVAEKEIGGNFLIEGSFEHRFNPFSNMLGYFKDLGFVTFFDYGNAWSNAKEFRFDEVGLSVGAGLRYYTRIGAVRFDMGFKLYDPQPGHVGGSHWLFGSGANMRDKYTFQLGIGNTF